MSVIWKYNLKIVDGKQQIEMPKHADVLCVQAQYGEIMVWVQVNTTAPSYEEIGVRNFVVVGTGHQYDHEDSYIGTVQIGSRVWHVFEAD